MVKKKRRGLGDLGVDVLLSAVSSVRNEEVDDTDDLKMLPVETISRGQYQPRRIIEPEALEELAESIRAQGMVQPVVVRPSGDGYELIAGERRWRAAQMVGMAEVPAVVKQIPDQAAAAMSLIENIQREDLNPLEEAGAFERLIEEFELTHQQVAEAVGRSRVAVSNLLRLLELNDDVKQFLDQGQLEMGHARALLPLDSKAQAPAARHIIAKKLSVRETERYVKQLQNNGGAQTAKAWAASKKEPDIVSLEQTLSEKLGAPVDIQHSQRGKGKLVIRYSSVDELDGILERIK